MIEAPHALEVRDSPNTVNEGMLAREVEHDRDDSGVPVPNRPRLLWGVQGQEQSVAERSNQLE